MLEYVPEGDPARLEPPQAPTRSCCPVHHPHLEVRGAPEDPWTGVSSRRGAAPDAVRALLLDHGSGDPPAR